MREEETGARYLSPLVKQDLARLDWDGESRRIALNSLKQFIDQLDATSMPKFLSQIAESRECGGSRAYAISLYEEVARVHRKLIRPHLPRVMSSVIRALAASGSSPQLQQACAKVTAAMARYTIDPTMSIEDAEEIIRAVCDPLAEALTGKLEPVAAGAAACIHALIETENWKYASEETVHAVCQRITVALSEKSSRTVFHLQLASALSSMYPDTLSLYGKTLVRTAAEILKVSVDSWQHRKAAAKLLQGVLLILDKETLETEVDLVIHVLESCRLDKMPHVRVAVSEALYAAKMLANGDSSQSYLGLNSPLCKSVCKSMEQQSSCTAWTKRDVEQSRTPWTSKEDMDHCQSTWSRGDLALNSPVQKRIVSPTSQESNQLSFSPASTSTTESLHIRRNSIPVTRPNNGRRAKRTPLFPARDVGFAVSSRCSSPGMLSPSGSISHDCVFTPKILDHAKENMPVRITNVNGTLPIEEVRKDQGQAKACNPPVPSLHLDKFTDSGHTPELNDRKFAGQLVDRLVPHAGKELSDDMTSAHMASPIVSAILDELTETASNILAEDDAGLALIDSQIEEARYLKPNFRNGVLPRLRIRFRSPDSSSKTDYAAENSNQSFAHPTMQQNENCPYGRNEDECVEECVEDEIGGANFAAADTLKDSSPGREEGSDQNALRERSPRTPVKNLKHHYNALTHLDFSPERSQSLMTAKEFLPLATPTRLMRALQSLNTSNPDPRGIPLSEDVTLWQHDAAIPIVVDMGAKASSDMDWNGRDIRITSEESFQADTSDEELEERLELTSAGAQLQSILSSNTRDIHMFSPAEQARTHQHSSSESYFTPTQPINCVKCNVICSAVGSDVRRPTSSERRFSSQIVNEAHISSGFAEDEIEKNELCCNCLALSEGRISSLESSPNECEHRQISSQRPSQRWWSGRFSLVRWLSKTWINLCWFGEITLGGTLCMILSLPLAMALAKALNSTPEQLVPT